MIPKTPYGEELNNIYPDEKGIHNVYAFLKKLSVYTNVVWFGSRIQPHINPKRILKNCGQRLRNRASKIGFEESRENLLDPSDTWTVCS